VSFEEDVEGVGHFGNERDTIGAAEEEAFGGVEAEVAEVIGHGELLVCLRLGVYGRW
jgi:hypothetical protein